MTERLQRMFPNEEPERMVTCEPFPDALGILNKWYDEGHIITFFTSRTEENRDVTESMAGETWGLSIIGYPIG